MLIFKNEIFIKLTVTKQLKFKLKKKYLKRNQLKLDLNSLKY